MFTDDAPSRNAPSQDAPSQDAPSHGAPSLNAAAEQRELLAAFRRRLAERVGWQRFETWFTGGTRLRIEGDRLAVEVPSPFHQDRLRRGYRQELEEVAAEILPEQVVVEIRVNGALAAEEAPAVSSEKDPPSQGASPAGQPHRAERATPGAPQSPRQSPLPPGQRPARRRELATFARFVEGATNRLAATSARLAVERPGQVSPLFLHGPTGTGKTHLLEAIVESAPSGSRPVLLAAEQFTNHFLEALESRGMPSFRRKVRGAGLLLLDDVQFFSRKRATLDELLHTVDGLLRDGRQLVLAADRPPQELSGLGAELVARLSGGLVCRLDPPEYDTRRGIVEDLCTALALEAPDDVQSLVATQVQGDARALRGALLRLQAAGQLAARPLDAPLAERALAELAAETCRVVRLPDIQRAVCDEFGLPPDSLQSRRQSAAVSSARMLAMFLARKHTRAALSEIGIFFGRRSHSTVVSASKKVRGWIHARSELPLTDRPCPVEEALRKVEQRLRAG